MDFLISSGLLESSDSRLLNVLTVLGSIESTRYMPSDCAINGYPKMKERIGINGNRRSVPTVTVVEAISTSKSNPEA